MSLTQCVIGFMFYKPQAHSDAGVVTQREIAFDLGVDQSSISRMLKR